MNAFIYGIILQWKLDIRNKGIVLTYYVVPLLLLPSIMLSGIMLPSNMLPKILRYAGKIFPATWGYLNICKDSLSQLSIIPLMLIGIVSVVIIVLKIKKLQEI